LAAAAAGRQEDPGKLVGETYAANTIGAILGAIGFSLIFVPWLGSRNSERLLILLAITSALLVLMPLARNWRMTARVAFVSVNGSRGGVGLESGCSAVARASLRAADAYCRGARPSSVSGRRHELHDRGFAA